MQVKITGGLAAQKQEEKPLVLGFNENLEDEPEVDFEEEDLLKKHNSEQSPAELPANKKKSVHFSSLQNRPIEMSCIDSIKNKLNLVLNVPSYFPLDSDLIQTHLMYRSIPIKKAKSTLTATHGKLKK